MRLFSKNVQTALSVGLLGGIVTATAPIASAGPYETITGSALCQEKPTNFILAVERLARLDPSEFKDPCRSGSGPCNDMYRLQFELARYAAGKAVVMVSNAAMGFTQTDYDLNGRVFEIPPTDWDSSDANRYEYILEATPRTDGASQHSDLEIRAVRYTGIYDSKPKLHLEIAGQFCEQVDFTYRRFSAPGLAPENDSGVGRAKEDH